MKAWTMDMESRLRGGNGGRKGSKEGKSVPWGRELVQVGEKGWKSGAVLGYE